MENKNTEKDKLEFGSCEYHLYHSYKNERAFIPWLVITFLLLFLKNGIILVIFSIIWYFFYCSKNNRELDNSPYIQQQRKIWCADYENKKKEGK